jgi:hypothetical protein
MTITERTSTVNIDPRIITTLAMLGLLTSCSGGGGTSVAGIDRGGITGGGAVGSVTGFGSVFVNGTRYETDGAVISIDGQAAAEADLELGFVVAIDAEIDAIGANALSVDFESNVIGPVSDIDLNASTLTVLGQTVLVDTATYFDDTLAADGLAGLEIDDSVRVSGFVDIDDRIVATRVDRLAGAARFELLGFAREVDTVNKRFRIGAQLIDYASAGIIDGFPAGEPASGDLVRVEGRQLGAADELIADEVVLKASPLDLDEDEEIEVQGFITSFVSAADFRVSGIPVTTDGNTQFEDGTAGDLGPNVRVEVEGRVLDDGRLLAVEIEFETAGNLRIEATVEAVDTQAETLTALGITVQAQGLTDLSGISAGDCAKIVGVESTVPGEVIATRLENEDSCDTTLLRGVVVTVSDPTFTLLGVTVRTDANTDFPGGSAAAFFAAAVDRLVEAKGLQSGSELLAEQIEFKN